MTFEECQLKAEELASKETALRAKALRRATFAFRKASARGDDHIVRTVLDTPEPTLSFRMIRKASLRPGAPRVDKQDLYVYVPLESDPLDRSRFVDRFWTKFVLENGTISGMFEVREDWSGVYRPEEDLEEMARKIGEDSGEISAEAIAIAGINHSTTSIRGLEAIIKAMRDDYEFVPYDFQHFSDEQ